jgi:microcompartment protein CcmK/EutM
MYLARVIKKITATQKHRAYDAKSVFLVQSIYPDGVPAGEESAAMDYVGASVGDIVVCGGAPGTAQSVFNLDKAPIRTLIMAIVDTIDYRDTQ